ncbi:MAG: RNA-guided endonuclease InsQ/TnpB family protein [Candidatus Odinarchaeia archaeon]
MKVQKTIKISVSDKITHEKLEKLNRLTARLTYGVQLFLDKIIANDITTVKEAEKYRKEVQQLTGLPSAFTQACRDKALWMYKSYKKLHKEWEKSITKLEKSIEDCKDKHKQKKLKHKLYRLRKREPSLPTINHKTSIMFDYRIGSIEFSHSAKEFRLWIRISTLENGKRIDIPLHSYPYAERHLKEWKIKSFQIVYRSKLKRYEVHVVVEREVVVSKPKRFVGVDLGLKRIITAYEVSDEENRVLLYSKEEYKQFFIRMRKLNNRIAKLQRLGKIRLLKKLKHKRRNYAIDFRRKLAVKVAKHFSNSIVFIGLPKNVRMDKHYKGSSNCKLRKRVNHWAFREFAEMLKVELMERGNATIIVNEWMSTKQCSECGSRNVQIEDREFLCLDCGHKDDRDVNAAKNILKKGLTKVSSRTGGAVNHPELSMIACMGLKVEAPSVRAGSSPSS